MFILAGEIIPFGRLESEPILTESLFILQEILYYSLLIYREVGLRQQKTFHQIFYETLNNYIKIETVEIYNLVTKLYENLLELFSLQVE